MLKFFRKHNADLELVGKLNGQNIYQKKNLFDLPSNRAFACLRELYFINNWAASKEEVLKYIEGFEKSFNEQRLADAATFVKILKIKAQQQPQEESLVNLASSYFYLKNEQDELNARNIAKKQKLFQDFDNSGFFLTFVLRILTDYKSFVAKDLQTFSTKDRLIKDLQESIQKKK